MMGWSRLRAGGGDPMSSLKVCSLLVLSVAACGGGSKAAPPPKVAEVAPTPPPPPPPPPPTEREQKVADRYLECLRPVNMKDLAAIAACYSDSAETTFIGDPTKYTGGKEAAEKVFK